MKRVLRSIASVVTGAMLALPGLAVAQPAPAIPPSLTTPDKIETRIGTLEFKDGAPSVDTAEKVRDALAFTAALNVFNNSFRGASAYAIRKGFHSIGAEDNTVVIFSNLMDAKSLFLTANADTIYYLAAIDLTKGPMVVEQPPAGLGAFNDMWFSWIIDAGAPGPDRGHGGKYLILPPGYDGPLPEGAISLGGRARTGFCTLCARSLPTTTRNRPSITSRTISRSIPTRRVAMARASRRRSTARSGSEGTRRLPRLSSPTQAARRSIRSHRTTTRSSR